ncbi:ThiF family adenylyltransferase [Brevibacillus laterosporus]|uniref:ThiF family adenylyltransferase n=1 Tax=Brevibacillus laterosporus TaxID=1465 RepID=UPI0018CCA88D|nr:ThiF family adenylyltransferase [Brevibacillus laterosporus]MBG9790527.1 hypothetical protein [Brevibacillus laterosporus]
MIRVGEGKDVFFYLVQIGCGGNGSYILQQCAQMMNIFNCDGRYIIADPDIVEHKNLNNQLFISKDVGKTKASVLAKRYSSHYKLPIASYDQKYIEDGRMLHNLFQHTDYTGCYHWNKKLIPILIGAVDNNFTRKIMHQFFLEQESLVYIDVGVESAWVPQDGRKEQDWSEEEINKHRNTGWGGQVVIGFKEKGKVILDPVANRFPDILEGQDEIAPSEVACSNIVVNEPQRLFTNRCAALVVAGYLNELLSEKTISNHVTFFHAKKQYMRSEKIN